jgi:pimeloyl-ACP methyl ester carboxylesterase
VNVLFLHGFPLDERMWKPQRAALSEHTVIAPRLYGRGRTMAAWADSVAGETEGELVLVGSSMGGYCALALAKRAPERVSAMLLCGSRPDADSDERRAGREDTIDLIRTEGADGLWETMVPKLFADESSADKELLFRDPDGLVSAVEAIRDREDSTTTARSFNGTLQWVVGDADPFVSAAELAGYDVREVEGTGHMLNLERPKEFNEIMRDFLVRV